MAGQDIAVTARLLTGDEAEGAYAVMEATARTYAVYRDRTGRQIRVFRLAAV